MFDTAVYKILNAIGARPETQGVHTYVIKGPQILLALGPIKA